MQHLTPSVIRDITGGEVRGTLPEKEISAITIDSRTITLGCLFAAIPGERSDGNDYISDAAYKGASCVLCNRFANADVAQLCVPDTQAALRAVAAFYRSQFSFPFVGVTGSVGKTTAKEMIASVLSARFNTLKTLKNHNNELGVPLTLFRLNETHEAAVVEMGISGFGEMTRLADMVHPQIAVFTLIGDAHLEFLGDRNGVLRAKGEIVNGMPADGIVIANGDDPLLKSHDFGRKTLLFGLGENCHVRAEDVRFEGLAGTHCVIKTQDRHIPVDIPAFGQHLVYAALMGAAVGLALGLTDDEIRRGISAYENVGSRSNAIQTGGITILDDCYNANPTSARSAIDGMASLPGRHIAILGDMLELGRDSAALHRALGEYAAASGVKVVACGSLSFNTAQSAGGDALWFENTPALLCALPDIIQKGDVVLVKASHAMRFEDITAMLKDMII